MVLFRATKLVFNRAMLAVGVISREVSALDGGMLPVLSIPLAKSIGSCLSG